MSFEQLNVKLPEGVRGLIPRGRMSEWVTDAIRGKYEAEVKAGERLPAKGHPVAGVKVVLVQEGDDYGL